MVVKFFTHILKNWIVNYETFFIWKSNFVQKILLGSPKYFLIVSSGPLNSFLWNLPFSFGDSATSYPLVQEQELVPKTISIYQIWGAEKYIICIYNSEIRQIKSKNKRFVLLARVLLFYQTCFRGSLLTVSDSYFILCKYLGRNWTKKKKPSLKYKF